MIEIIYSLLDCLPFDFLHYSFMKNAFLAVLLVTPLFGVLSTMVVSNRMAFFADSLGHGAFTGIALGTLIGIFSPQTSLAIFSLLFAVVITYIKNKSNASTDTIIGVFSSTAIALGLMLLSHGGSFNKYSVYLIGDILSITPGELGALAAVVVFVIAVWALIFNRLLVVSLNAPFARSRGFNVFWLESAFAALIALVVAFSIQWVGILIINSLLILPAAAARNIAHDVRSYHVISVGVSFVSGIAGLLLAYYCDMAAGASIVAVAAGIFFITLFLRKKERK